MISVEEKYIDKLTETVYRILKGEIPPLLVLPDSFPDNEIKQFIEYFNTFLDEHNELLKFTFSIAQGELNYDPPKSKMKVVQSFKSLQSNLRHLTWKTQKIASGDFSQKVDFIGDFSIAFNSMTQQLKDAFDEINEKNEELNQQNEEIATQRDEIEEKQNIVLEQNEELHQTNEKLSETLEIVNKQKFKIEEAHNHIQHSINYARRIQTAVLPSQKQLEKILPEHFILFKPCNIVSGDFYWMQKVNKYILIAAADCTGHGVPGAFMSMLGISFLNEIVIKSEIKQASHVLDELRDKIKTTLDQTGQDDIAKDGMDIAFCAIDTETNELQYSGAYNPLYLFRNNELIEYKANRQPIGIHRKETAFSNHKIRLEKKDTLYLFSDGYVDQLGGEKQRKFLSKRFKELLSDIQDKNMEEQKQILNKTFIDWRGNTEQIDDVVVIGIRI